MANYRLGDGSNNSNSDFNLPGVKIAIGAILVILVLVFLFGSFFIVEPGNRGVLVTLGSVSSDFKSEGVGFKLPLITTVHEVSVRQQTEETDAPCYSSDLQPIEVKVKVLYRIPESQVVNIFQQYRGDPFQSLIVPRVQEALKEFTAQSTAEQIVKQRELLKTQALASTRTKVGNVIEIVDLVVENIDLSAQLEGAIEEKMVQEQEASKSKFVQEKTRIEAETAIIKAKGEAESIRIKGEALRQTPELLSLQIVEKWDGRAPLVYAGNAGGSEAGGTTSGVTNLLLPIDVAKLKDVVEKK